MEAKSNSKKGDSSDEDKTYSVTDISIVAVIAGVVGIVLGMILMKSHAYFTRSHSDEIAYHKLQGPTRESEI